MTLLKLCLGIMPMAVFSSNFHTQRIFRKWILHISIFGHGLTSNRRMSLLSNSLTSNPQKHNESFMSNLTSPAPTKSHKLLSKRIGPFYILNTPHSPLSRLWEEFVCFSCCFKGWDGCFGYFKLGSGLSWVHVLDLILVIYIYIYISKDSDSVETFHSCCCCSACVYTGAESRNTIIH